MSSEENKQTLDQILTALQKSFSRLNDSTDVELMATDMKSLARINNNIKFDITLNVIPEDDKLIYADSPGEGTIKINITGDINPDINENEEIEDNFEKIENRNRDVRYS